jgi:hypothetical protein
MVTTYMITIPWETLNNFYFDKFIPTLHPDLQKLATDLRVLRHSEEETHITTIENVFQTQYTALPYLLNDIFQLPDELLLQLASAWICHFWDFVITDSIVDNQIENPRQVILLQQHIRHYALALYQRIFDGSHEFWQLLHADSQTIWNALAHEVHCVDLHQKPFTYEDMVLVNNGKAAPFRLMVYMMAQLSGNLKNTAMLQKVYDNLILSDQLVDDASDWQDDFKQGRITLPLTMCLERANLPIEQALTLNEDQYERVFHKHEIGQQIAHKAIALLDECIEQLEIANLTNTNLFATVQSRHAMANREIGRYHSLRFFKVVIGGLQ